MKDRLQLLEENRAAFLKIVALQNEQNSITTSMSVSELSILKQIRINSPLKESQIKAEVKKLEVLRKSLRQVSDEVHKLSSGQSLDIFLNR